MQQDAVRIHSPYFVFTLQHEENTAHSADSHPPLYLAALTAFALPPLAPQAATPAPAPAALFFAAAALFAPAAAPFLPLLLATCVEEPAVVRYGPTEKLRRRRPEHGNHALQSHHAQSAPTQLTCDHKAHHPALYTRLHTARPHTRTRAEMSSGPLSSPSPWPSPSSTASSARSSLASSSRYSSSSSPVAVGYRTEQE
jgi:hypothetical protein